MRVFISHGPETAEVGNRLGAYLEQHGCEALRTLRGSQPTVKWQDELSKMLASVDGFVLVVDPKPSHVERFEWSLALQESWSEDDKRIVPLFFEGVDVPAFLNGVPGIYAASPDSVDEALFGEVLQLLKGSESPAAINQVAAHQQLLERLDLAIDALSQEESDEEELLERRQELEKAPANMYDAKSLAMSDLSIGLIDLQMNDASRALRHLSSALSVCISAGAPEYPSKMIVMLPLSHAMAEVGMLDEAVDMLTKAVDIRGRHEGVKAPGVIAANQELGVLLVKAGHARKARKILERTLEVNRQKLGHAHPRVGANEYWLATACEHLGDHEEATRLFEGVDAGGDEPNVAEPRSQVQHLLGLGRTLNELGDLNGAREVLLRAWQMAGSTPEVSRSVAAACAFAYGMALLRGGDCEGAIDALKESLKANTAEEEVGERLAAAHYMGVALRLGGRLDRAHEVLTENLTETEKCYGASSRHVAESLFDLGLVARDRHDVLFARECIQRAVEIDREAAGDSNPRVHKYLRVLARLSEHSSKG